MEQRFVNTGSTAGGDGTTNATSGGTRAFASLADWENSYASSVATEDYVADCCGATVDPSGAIIIDFPTAPTTGSITVQANVGEADGKYNGNLTISTSHYRLDPGNTTYALRLNENRTYIKGLQILAAHSGANGYAIFANISEYSIEQCRLLNTASTDYGAGNTTALSAHTPRSFINNLIVGFDAGGIAINITNFFTPTVNILHNTIYGDSSSAGGGIRYGGASTNTGTVFNIKGNAAANNGSGNDLIKVNASGSTDTFTVNAFEHSESTSGEVSISSPSAAWTSPGTGASSDFSILDGSSPLNTAVSGTGVTVDINNVTRTTGCIGCFEYVAPPSGTNYGHMFHAFH